MSKTQSFLTFFAILTMSAVLLLFSLHSPSKDEIIIRQSFTKVTGLPDISVYIESPSERFRTLAHAGDIYNTDPFSPDTDFSAIIYKKVRKN